MDFNVKNQRKLIALIAIGLVAIIAISAVIVSVLAPKKTPVASEYITVTIDNSVSASFTLNNNDYSVLGAETYKKSDSYLVDDINGMGISFMQAMDSFLKELDEAGKITADSDEVLLFSVESRNEEDFEALSSYFRNAISEAELKTRIYTLFIKVKTDSVQKLAEKYEVSYAKAHLCTKLEKENRKLDAEKLIILSVTDIVKRVNEVAADDLISKVESDTNEEQREEEIHEETPSDSSSSSSDSASSDATSSDSTSSDATSSDTTSSDTTSSSTSSGNNVSFIVSSDDKGWLPGVH